MSESEHIEMKEAIEILGTTQPTFYRWLREGRIQGTKLGRRWRFLRGDVERLLRGESAAASAPSGTEQAVKSLREQVQHLGGTLDARSDDPVDDLITAMIQLALALEASDLHLEPQRDAGRMRFRVDGILQDILRFPNDVLDASVQNWKGKAHCNVHIKDLPQDGRITLRSKEKEADVIIRITTVPTTLGESITVRFLVEEKGGVDLDRIDFMPEHRARIDDALNSQTGLIIVSGPTGSGKTTTLYALLNKLATPEKKIMSIEDPVEFILPGVNQIQSREDKLPFSHAIRACLRSDPDVLMVGEVRSREVMEMIHQAALQGILVVTTMHTTDAVAAIIRLRDMGIDNHLMVDVLRLIIAQRLVRRLCPHCKKKHSLDEGIREYVEMHANMGGLDPDTLTDNWHEAVGCDRCNQLGYRGRVVINETLEISSLLRKVILSEAHEDELNAAARASGYNSIAVDAIRRAAAGETSFEEFRRVCAM